MDKIELLKLTKELTGQSPITSLIEQAKILENYLTKPHSENYIEQLKNNSIFSEFIKLFPNIEYQEWYETILNNDNNSLIFGKRRQGITTFICLYILFLTCNKSNENILMLTVSQRESNYVREIILELFSKIDENFKPSIIKCNTNLLEFDNGIKIYFRIFDENAARCMSLNYIFVDNFEFIPFSKFENTLKNVLPTMIKGKILMLSTNDNRKTENLYHYNYLTNIFI